jgi:uncharacterized protein YodC (DUF2158 family)
MVLTADTVRCIKNIVKKQRAFKAGDAVELKSGGPRMIVMDIASNKLRCSWFAGTTLKSALFPPRTLKVPDADVREEKAKVWTELAMELAAAREALPPAPTEPATGKRKPSGC